MQATAADKSRNKHTVIAIACFFFLSGFCSLLYQTIWLRLAFADFGVITPVVSVVVSLFMFGLAVGSRFGGKFIASLMQRYRRPGLFFYAITELITALGGLAVPFLFSNGSSLLLNAGATDSFGYLAFSALAIGVSILPWAIAMGATFPFAMAHLRHIAADDSKSSFGFLYLANVAGATFGSVIPVMVLIELFGFQHCLQLAAGLNLAIAICAAALAGSLSRAEIAENKHLVETHHPAQNAQTLPMISDPLLADEAADSQSMNTTATSTTAASKNGFGFNGCILFTTGLVSLSVEVCWTRLFTPVLGTVVYSFAWILAVYLASTFFGSWLYRLNLKFNAVKSRATLLGWTAASAFLPIVLNDPRLPFASSEGVALLSIAPFCAALGYLTPMIIDEVSAGDPEAAGTAYGINVVGGIIGPLLTGYLLLPIVGVKLSLMILCLPLVALAVYGLRSKSSAAAGLPVAASIALLVASVFCWSWEERFPSLNVNAEIHRDYAATTVCSTENKNKLLYVNGINMTSLCRTTKYMAHVPLAILKKPEKVLIICFGMGTTYRSMLTWPGIDVTAIELIPGVKSSFHYFWTDAEKVMNDSRGRVVVDDGRRFLKRSPQRYDLITVDPPPPVQAAGSSLLYSKNFYSLVKNHLSDDGIFCQWYPSAMCKDETILRAVARSVAESFPYIKVYRSVDDFGYHFFCSNKPLPQTSPANVWSRMPESARVDMMEFEQGDPAATQQAITKFCSSEESVQKLYNPSEDIKITDDRPYNEYFWLRRNGLH